MRQIVRLVMAIASSSVMWGSLAAIGFFTLIHHDVLPFSKELRRYTCREWAEVIEASFFFVGAAELTLKLFDISEQRGRLRKNPLGTDFPPGPLPVSYARTLLDHLKQLPEREMNGYWPRRVRESLEAVWRKNSANALDDEIKHLSALDATRSHDGFAFSRIVIWAIPIWGFLGTVLGITDAISSLNPTSMENTLSQVTASLGGVFDTTALALGLSIALMFWQYGVDRMEVRLLHLVDELCIETFTNRFEVDAKHDDPQLASIDRMSERVIENVERLVGRQAEVWQRTIEAAHERWNELTSGSEKVIETALGRALAKNVQMHVEQLAAAEATHSDRTRRHWRKLYRAIVESHETAHLQHVELVKQGEVLREVVEATGQVTRLEDALNRNLSSLANASHFQETLLTLSAAIQLLNARLAQLAPMGQHVELKDRSLGKAA